VEAAGCMPHIRRIGEEKLDARRKKRYPARLFNGLTVETNGGGGGFIAT
jgi:hypothetical protein